MSYSPNRKSAAILLCLLSFTAFPLSGVFGQQNNADNTIQSIERNKTDNSPTSITFSPAAKWSGDQAQEIFSKYLGVDGVDNTMVLTNTTTTKMGITSKRYYEYYKGVKVEYGSYTLAIKDGRVGFITGNYYDFSAHPTATPAISEATAFAKAIASVGAEKYMWEDPREELRIKNMYHKSDTSFLPHGELTWIEDYNNTNDDRKLHLAWAFDIYAKKPVSRQKVFIDAATGKVLYSNQMIKHTAATGHSMYSGAVPMVTSIVAGTYELYDSTRGNGVHTFNMNNGTDYFAASEFTSAANTWPTSIVDSQAVDAHWAGEKVYDYWRTVQGRLSWDNLDGILLQYVHYDMAFDNAFWDGTEMSYGDGSGCGSGFTALVSLDVTAHEIGHGVCQATCNLLYEKEPGGIDEGLSDCWGATIENWANPHEVDATPKSTWEMGEEIGCGTPLRRIDYPKLMMLPDTYLGTYWYDVTSCVPDGTNDQCGVHTNMGVISKWYYLITVGGSGTNDLGNAYTVGGLTFTESQNILYQTELVLANNATYPVLRTTAINTTALLYGACSPEVVSVTNAWYAVGVGAAYTSSVTPVTGVASVCAGSTTLLSDVTLGGTWASGNTAVATIGSLVGTVTGVSAGTSLITYTLASGCSAFKTVTVNPMPLPIFGATSICQGATTTLFDPSGTGTWLSGSPSVATVNSSGMVTGINPGTSVIDYTLPTGCFTSTTMAVNALPAPITGAPSICAGSSTTLSDISGGGLFGSTSGIVSVVPATGFVTGLSAGTAIITYTLATGCTATFVETVTTSPAAISGTLNVCAGTTTLLNDVSPLGSWSSSNTAVATIGSATGSATGITNGTATISYTVASGCSATATFIVNAAPAPIVGSSNICTGNTATLIDITSGGTWSSSNTLVATVSSGGGIVTGIGAGTSSITYTLPTGCSTSLLETVGLSPAAITGTPALCVTLTTTLNDVTPGGAWTSNNTAIATVGTGSGIVSGITPGTTIISYTLPSGCSASSVVTVNSLPVSITAPASLCSGNTTTVSDGVTGGAWSSSNTAVATVGTTGVVAAIATGTTTITYTLGAGCFTTADMTVIAGTAAITGASSVCLSATTTLGDVTPGGTWSSSNTAIATIGSATGDVSGILAGTASIFYTLPNGCSATSAITVTPPFAAPVTGGTVACTGQTTTLTDITTGGTWTSSNPASATIGSATGIVTGIAPGTSVISYSVMTLCGVAIVTLPITVSTPPVVAAISGLHTVCSGATLALSDATSAGLWSSSNNAIATVSSAGLVSGLTSGTATISYSVTNIAGCTTSAISALTVTAPPAATITPSGPTTFCTGGSVLLSAPTGAGFAYQWHLGGAIISGASTSSYFTTMGGNYSVVVNSGSGCIATSARVTVTVNPSPVVPPSVSISANTGNILCVVASPVTFTATAVNGGSAPAFQWYVNGVAMGTGVTFTYTPANGDIVKCRLTSNYICAVPDTAIASTTMTISPLLTPAVSINTVPGTSVCQGETATFNAVPVNGGTAPTYLWTLNGVNVATGPTYVIYTPATSDVIKCYMTSNFHCLATPIAASAPVTLTVSTPTTNTVTITVSQSSTIAGKADTFTATAPFGGAAPAYQWFINGIPVAGATNNVFITSALTNGEMVNCEETSSNPCSFPNTATSSGIIVSVGTNGITPVASIADFTLVPNPNKGEFTISGTLKNVTDGRLSIVVTDMLGQVVYTGAANVANGQVNEHISLAPSLASGMYIVNITSGADHHLFHVVIDK